MWKQNPLIYRSWYKDMILNEILVDNLNWSPILLRFLISHSASENNVTHSWRNTHTFSLINQNVYDWETSFYNMLPSYLESENNNERAKTLSISIYKYFLSQDVCCLFQLDITWTSRHKKINHLLFQTLKTPDCDNHHPSNKNYWWYFSLSVYLYL